MSKPIRLTEKMKQECLEDFTKQLNEVTLFDGKAEYKFNYYYPGKARATVVFTQLAWAKQNRLVQEFSSEVGWHGIAKRDADAPSKFIIEDLLVFPQEVTSATVVPEQGKYDIWNCTLPPEQKAHLRYHGHSHVNMSTSPSTTDNTFQNGIIGRLNGDGYTDEARQEAIQELGDTAFYIFMIWNKRGEHNVRIFDLYDNVYYDNTEVDIIVEGQEGLDAFMADAKAKVTNKSYTYNSGYYASTQNRSGAARTETPGQKALSLPGGKGNTGKEQPPEKKLGDKTSMLDDDHTAYPFGYWDGYDWHD